MVGRLNRDIPGSAGKTAACHSLILHRDRETCWRSLLGRRLGTKYLIPRTSGPIRWNLVGSLNQRETPRLVMMLATRRGVAKQLYFGDVTVTA